MPYFSLIFGFRYNRHVSIREWLGWRRTMLVWRYRVWREPWRKNPAGRGRYDPDWWKKRGKK